MVEQQSVLEGYKFRTPFNIIAVGRTGSGKSTVMSKLLGDPELYAKQTMYDFPIEPDKDDPEANKGEVIMKKLPFSKFKRVVVVAPEKRCFALWNSKLRNILEQSDTDDVTHDPVVFGEGVPRAAVENVDAKDFSAWFRNNCITKSLATNVDPWLIVCDDFQTSDKDILIDLDRLFTSLSHHSNVSVLLLLQHHTMKSGSNAALKRNVHNVFHFGCCDLAHFDDIAPYLRTQAKPYKEALGSGVVDTFMNEKRSCMIWDLHSGRHPDNVLFKSFNDPQSAVPLSLYTQRSRRRRVPLELDNGKRRRRTGQPGVEDKIVHEPEDADGGVG